MRPLPQAWPHAFLDLPCQSAIRLRVRTANHDIRAVLSPRDGFVDGHFLAPKDRPGPPRRQSSLMNLRRCGVRLGWFLLLGWHLLAFVCPFPRSDTVTPGLLRAAPEHAATA